MQVVGIWTGEDLSFRDFGCVVPVRVDRHYVIGSGAGHGGGQIVFVGTPADLVAACSTLTGEHLAEYFGT